MNTKTENETHQPVADTEFAAGYAYSKFDVEAPPTAVVSFEAFLRGDGIVKDGDLEGLRALDVELEAFLREELRYSQGTVTADLKRELAALRSEDKPIDELNLSKSSRRENAREQKRILRERRKKFVAEKMVPAIRDFMAEVMPSIRVFVDELVTADEKHCASLNLPHEPSWPTQCAQRTLSQLETRLANYKSNRTFGSLFAKHALASIVTFQ